MIELDLLIRNRLGLHARAASKFVHTACRYRSKIHVAKDGLCVDGKSILGMLSLAGRPGVHAHGPGSRARTSRMPRTTSPRFWRTTSGREHEAEGYWSELRASAVGKALVLETRDTTIIRVPIEPEFVEDEVQRFLAAARRPARRSWRSGTRSPEPRRVLCPGVRRAGC